MITTGCKPTVKCNSVVTVLQIVCVWLGGGEMHLPASALDESVKKEQTKSKAIEIKYIDKMKQHDVGWHIN